MNYREHWEQIEKEILSPGACFSSESGGRVRPEEPCPVRTAFQRDRDRILHSKSFRRLKHKTQVFILPGGDHFRTRLTHTLEVAQIARTIARALRLNEDLTEAISLGHDLGHTPFGHAGEDVLSALLPEGFRHNEQSLRVVEILENGRKGLNLTVEVRDGILNHTGKGIPLTLEGQIVKTADRIAYINHDIDDALRAGIIAGEQLPREAVCILGESHSRRINAMVNDMIEESLGQKEIRMSSRVREAMDQMRTFLFENVYVGSSAKEEDEKVRRLITEMFDYYMEDPERLPQEYREGTEPARRRVADYISGMTDSFATRHYMELFVPKGYRNG